MSWGVSRPEREGHLSALTRQLTSSAVKEAELVRETQALTWVLCVSRTLVGICQHPDEAVHQEV
jgi:hypothetical protein